MTGFKNEALKSKNIQVFTRAPSLLIVTLARNKMWPIKKPASAGLFIGVNANA